MKKIVILLICSLCFLAGCSANNDEVVNNNDDEVIWTVKPSLDYDYVVYPNTLSPMPISNEYQIREFLGYPNFKDYVNDAIFVVKDRLIGIFDYEGNVIQAIDKDRIINGFSPYFTEFSIKDDPSSNNITLYWGLANFKYNDDIPELVDKYITNKYWTNGYAKGIVDEYGQAMQRAVYASDFKSFDSLVPVGFGGGGYPKPMWVVMNGEIISSGLIAYDKAGDFYLANISHKPEEFQNWIKETEKLNQGKNLLLPVVADKPYYEEEYQIYYPYVDGLAIYNAAKDEIKILEDTYVYESYINGFYAVTDYEANAGKRMLLNHGYASDTEYKSMWNVDFEDNFYYELQTGDDALFGFVNAETNEAITAIEYDDLLYFSEGIAGVCKDGKWAFIDESGKLLSDFIFEDISPVVNGKSYVQVNGYYGILNLKETIDKQIPIKYANLKVDEAMQKPKFELPISHIRARVDTIRIRYDHSTDSETIGYIGREEDVESAYVYEYYKDDDYMWFRIGDHAWVASSLDENWYFQNVNKKINLEAWNK